MKFLVITGASGGHIFPALAFIDSLKDKCRDTDVLLVLPRQSVVLPGQVPADKVKYIPISPIRFSLDFKKHYQYF